MLEGGVGRDGVAAVAVEAVLTETVGETVGAEETGRELVVGTAGAERLGV